MNENDNKESDFVFSSIASQSSGDELGDTDTDTDNANLAT
jgi:hypothetical protein